MLDVTVTGDPASAAVSLGPARARLRLPGQRTATCAPHGEAGSAPADAQGRDHRRPEVTVHPAPATALGGPS